MRRLLRLLVIAVVSVGAFFLRYPGLDKRPMHTDEAVHAFKLGILLDTGNYEYNPSEYHGPTIYYPALALLKLEGISRYADIPNEIPLRLPIVVFGTMMVFAVACGKIFLGTREALWAALFFAVSPAFVFYGKYFIQEIPFVLFFLLALAFFFVMFREISIAKITRRSLVMTCVYMALAGIFLGLTIATKETWVILFGTAFSCGLFVYLKNRYALHLTRRRRLLICLSVFNAGVLAIATATLLLTNFFHNPHGAFGMFEAVSIYVHRGIKGSSSTFAEAIHNHPWYYYFDLLIYPDKLGKIRWTEIGVFLFGFVGLAAVWVKRKKEEMVWEFIALNTIALTVIYSLIPYKTPWNCLPFYSGWILLAGKGIAELSKYQFNSKSLRIAFQTAVVCVGGAWAVWSADRAWLASYKFAADYRVPYAYSPTSPNVTKVRDRAEQIAAISPDGYDMLISVVSHENDYWPLPWYLRKFGRIAYFTDDSDALISQSAMVLINSEMEKEIATLAVDRHTDFFGLRPDVLFVALIENRLWDKFIATVE